jgi:hypothetical protein
VFFDLFNVLFGRFLQDLPSPTLIDTLVENPDTWSSVGGNSTFDSLFQDLTVTQELNATQIMLTEASKKNPDKMLFFYRYK